MLPSNDFHKFPTLSRQLWLSPQHHEFSTIPTLQAVGAAFHSIAWERLLPVARVFHQCYTVTLSLSVYPTVSLILVFCSGRCAGNGYICSPLIAHTCITGYTKLLDLAVVKHRLEREEIWCTARCLLPGLLWLGEKRHTLASAALI